MTQQQAAILLEALDLWVKQNGVRVAGAALDVLQALQEVQTQQQLPRPPRNGAFVPPSPLSQPTLPES